MHDQKYEKLKCKGQCKVLYQHLKNSAKNWYLEYRKSNFLNGKKYKQVKSQSNCRTKNSYLLTLNMHKTAHLTWYSRT